MDYDIFAYFLFLKSITFSAVTISYHNHTMKS